MTRHAFWLLLAVGCASPMSSLREDNRRLTRTVGELRADRRAQERRLRDLQHQLDLLRAERVTAVIGAMPSLPVEVAAPPPGSDAEREPARVDADGEPSRVVAVTEDGTEIVYEGEAALGRAAAWDDDPAPPPRTTTRARGAVTAERRDGARRAAAVATRAARPPLHARDRRSEPAGDAAQDYRAAVELLKAGRHADSIAALRAFVAAYPGHDYADNAQYWLGEAYYAQHAYAQALGEFRTVIETYPRGNKVPDALLKVGYCYQALGDAGKARVVLEQVVSLYPKTEPAALAATRLGERGAGVTP